jgi:hypothetical protein
MNRDLDRDIRVLALAAIAATILMPVASYAQAPPQTQAPVAPKSDNKSDKLDPASCANDRATVGQGGDLNMQKPAGQSLSDHLARSDGVICPPDQIDPEIKQPTPQGGSMPVIPPPSSPGGDPNVHPK